MAMGVGCSRQLSVVSCQQEAQKAKTHDEAVRPAVRALRKNPPSGQNSDSSMPACLAMLLIVPVETIELRP